MRPLDLARTLGLDALLRAQHDLIRRDQASALGYRDADISSAVRAGQWRRVLPRVYSVTAGALDPADRVRAAWLWAGDDSVIAESAAAWWSALHTALPPALTVVVPPNRRMSGRPGIRVVRARIDERDVMWHNGIRVTSVERTCLDLVRGGRDELVDDALRSRRLQLAQLPGSLQRSWHRRGQVRARQVAEEVSASPWSRPERHAHQLLRDAGITGWVANQRARSVRGKVRPDIGFDEVMLAVEIDGREHHDPSHSAQAFEDDHDRELVLIAAGWTVLRFTVRQIMERPEMFVRIVRETLERLASRRLVVD
jgi:very-short-patch-repair endonuclease